tara:strand:- start:1363 stop:2208 length:846 start_codon:yes stop_codon:yes gene_type:complete
MTSIDYTSRLSDLRYALNKILENSPETAVSLANKISFEGKNISDRAIREFVQDKRKSLSGSNYDLIVDYLMHLPCRFDYLNDFSDFVFFITTISTSITKEMPTNLKEICSIELPTPYGDDESLETEKFFYFLTEDMFGNWPEVEKDDFVTETINKYNPSNLKNFSFIDLICNSFKKSDTFMHRREVNAFKDAFIHLTNKIFIYGNILPLYLTKHNERQIALVISQQRAFNPVIEHTDIDRERSGMILEEFTDEKGGNHKRAVLLREYVIGDFFNPPLKADY